MIAYLKEMHSYRFAIGLTPRILETIVRQVPVVAWDVPTGEDRFTIREIVAHMADWEELFRARMQTAIAHPGNHVVLFDEGERALEQGYANTDVHLQLESFAEQRGETMRFLGDLKDEDWSRFFIHPEVGNVSIYDQASMLAGHDLYHLEQITTFLEGLG